MKKIIEMFKQYSDLTIKAREEGYLKWYEYYDMFGKHSYLPLLIINIILIIILILISILK